MSIPCLFREQLSHLPACTRSGVKLVVYAGYVHNLDGFKHVTGVMLSLVKSYACTDLLKEMCNQKDQFSKDCIHDPDIYQASYVE